MTVIIDASCPVCGDVVLIPRQITLTLCTRRDWSYYSFVCPLLCKDIITKPADMGIIGQLAPIRGINIVRWEIPAEALEEHNGPALTPDDVLDILNGLEPLFAGEG